MSCSYLDHFKRGDVVGAGNIDEVDVACEETVGESGHEAGGEDGCEGEGGGGHQEPGHQARHGRDDQQLPGAEQLLEETSQDGHQNGRNVLKCPDHRLPHRLTAAPRLVDPLVVLYQHRGEAATHSTRQGGVFLLEGKVSVIILYKPAHVENEERKQDQ